MNAKYFKVVSFLAVMLVLCLPILAQDPFGDPPDDTPIDGGLSLLVAAGIGYGAKKIKDKRKKNTANSEA